jgi:hypothetical protein
MYGPPAGAPPGGGGDDMAEAARQAQARRAATGAAGGAPGQAYNLGQAPGMPGGTPGAPPAGPAQALTPEQRQAMQRAAGGGGLNDYLAGHAGVAQHMDRLAAEGPGAQPGMQRFAGNMMDRNAANQPAPDHGPLQLDPAMLASRMAAAKAAGGLGAPVQGAAGLPTDIRPMPRGGGFQPLPGRIPGPAVQGAAGLPAGIRPMPRGGMPGAQMPGTTSPVGAPGAAPPVQPDNVRLPPARRPMAQAVPPGGPQAHRLMAANQPPRGAPAPAPRPAAKPAPRQQPRAKGRR